MPMIIGQKYARAIQGLLRSNTGCNSWVSTLFVKMANTAQARNFSVDLAVCGANCAIGEIPKYLITESGAPSTQQDVLPGPADRGSQKPRRRSRGHPQLEIVGPIDLWPLLPQGPLAMSVTTLSYIVKQ
jgi:hypothetical protein